MGDRILAIIPIRGTDQEFKDGGMPMLDGRPLIEYTLTAAKEARQLDRIIVSTDSAIIAEACRRYGVEVPFLRPTHLCAPSVPLSDVLRHTVDWLEREEDYRPEWVMKLEITHPFRPRGIIDWVIETALARQVDSAFLVYEEVHSYWTTDGEGKPQQVGEEVDVPSGERRPFYRDISGLAAITRTNNLKAGRLYGDNIGLIPWRDLFAIVDTHERGGASHDEQVGLRLAELLAPAFNRSALTV